ncbi:MAG: YraN family protein [Puniceicoccaceae bacterium]
MELWIPRSRILARLLGRLRPKPTSPAKPATRQERTGARAEARAAEWLQGERGSRILARNWTHGRDEIDIVAREGDVFVFVEVRARQAGALVPGFHSIDRRKKEALRRCALAYLRQCRPMPRHFRFDVVEVELLGEEIAGLRHYERVPLFRKHDRPPCS